MVRGRDLCRFMGNGYAFVWMVRDLGGTRSERLVTKMSGEELLQTDLWGWEQNVKISVSCVNAHLRAPVAEEAVNHPVDKMQHGCQQPLYLATPDEQSGYGSRDGSHTCQHGFLFTKTNLSDLPIAETTADVPDVTPFPRGTS